MQKDNSHGLKDMKKWNGLICLYIIPVSYTHLEEVINNVIGYAKENGFIIAGLTYSPVTGAKGNIEYLLHLSKIKDLEYNELCIHDVVLNSHKELE